MPLHSKFQRGVAGSKNNKIEKDYPFITDPCLVHLSLLWRRVGGIGLNWTMSADIFFDPQLLPPISLQSLDQNQFLVPLDQNHSVFSIK